MRRDEPSGSASGLGGLRLLVAVDLEERDRSAVELAYSLARQGGEVHLVNVVPSRALPDPLYAHYTPGRFPTEQEHAEELRERERRLLALAQAAPREAGTRVHVLEAEATEVAVAELATAVGVDLVCVLARRKVAPGRCGRLVRKLLARCPRPVVVVRPPRVAPTGKRRRMLGR